MTLKQAAETTGLSVSYIAETEKGQTNPTLATLAKLAECYGFVIRIELVAK